MFQSYETASISAGRYRCLPTASGGCGWHGGGGSLFALRKSLPAGEKNLERRLFEAYEEEVERDPKGHGIITAAVGDIDTATDGFPNNERLYLPAAGRAFGLTFQTQTPKAGPEV
jgi:hypothetical protein